MVSIIGDLVPALLPAYFLRNLQMSNKQKIAISTLMGLGIMYVLRSSVRIGTSNELYRPATCATIRTTMEYKATTKDAICTSILIALITLLLIGNRRRGASHQL